ncbi:MAG: hypothetical protein JOZ46_00785 [Candidatus Dormibacteraeota bacterium]|nr:hypothetical protein [Candidatus Dormibacteraeota bacterium]MBV9524329.1 hypothetical protein [Candidatus Dormibacteraeota bacterium]
MKAIKSKPRRCAAALPAVLAMILMAAGTQHAAAGAFIRAGILPGLGSGRIWDVTVDPGSPARMLAATDLGVYTSTDSGATWTLALPGGRAWVAGFDARNAANAFAGTAGRGVFASADSGTTWTAASSGLQNLDVRALAFGLDGIGAGTDAGVALSPDGHIWHDGGLDSVSISALAVAANAPQLTLVAGADSGSIGSGALFENTGSGGSWQALQSGLPSSAVVSSVAAGPIDAAVPKRPLVVATSKGLFRSGDGGVTWTSSTGIPEQLTATTVAFDPLDPSVVYAGADAAGSTGGDLVRSTDGGQTFAVADSGLPSSKNVETIGLGPTSPLTVAVGINPPSGGASVYTEADASLPPAPQLVAEAPGAPVPTVVATATPTPKPSLAPHRATPPAPPPSGLQQFASAAFHWPVPLVYEIIFVLLAAYAFVRWRQRYYVEGPP